MHHVSGRIWGLKLAALCSRNLTICGCLLLLFRGACVCARGAFVAACCCPLARWPCLCALGGAPGAIFDLLAFLALLVTGLFMGFKAMNAEPTVRVYYYINAYVCGVATFAYFAMLSGMGWETIMGCRQFFYVRWAPYLFCSHPCVHSLARAERLRDFCSRASRRQREA
jgi:hypothetical protein